MAFVDNMIPFIDSGPLSQVSAWLASESTWRQRIGEGWVGTRFLGKGGYGIVGLWEYKGDPANAPDITQVVVKQSEDNYANYDRNIWGGKTPYNEGVILKKLSTVLTNHIIKQYGGNRIGDRFMDMGYVVRIFLEFCPGGDMNQFIAGQDEEPMEPLDELDIWAIFNCLALGMTAMHHGTEDFVAPSWPGQNVVTEICHYDIKADNLLIGYRDGHHRRFPNVKIADFGEAIEVEKYRNQTDEYGAVFTRRGNVPFGCPEETINMPSRMCHPFQDIPIIHPRKGTCSNIWQLGAFMNCLLAGKMLNFNADDTPPPKMSYLTPPLSRGLNHSQGLDTDAMKKRFSRDLRTLIMQCLMREPEHRPRSSFLAIRTGMGLRTAKLLAHHTLDLPRRIATIPMVGLKQPEPPTAWNIDTSAYDMAQWDIEHEPVSSSGGSSWLDTNLVNYMLGWFHLAPLSPSSSNTAPSSPPPGTASQTARRGIFSSLDSWSNFGLFNRQSHGPNNL